MNRERIATVLRVRELQERLARQAVVKARMELIEHERAECRARAQVEARSLSAPGATAGSVLVDQRNMLSSGVKHTVRLAGRVHGAGRIVDGAMLDWRARAERLDGIERLSERAATLHLEEIARSESAAIDDVVIARWRTGGQDRSKVTP